MNDAPNYKWTIASDVGSRDGIGVELYVDDELVLEIFRDDTLKSREVILYKKEISLALMEETVARFRRDVPWDFLD